MQRAVILIVVVALILAVAWPALAAGDKHHCKTLMHHGRVHQIIKDTDVSSFRKPLDGAIEAIAGQFIRAGELPQE